MNTVEDWRKYRFTCPVAYALFDRGATDAQAAVVFAEHLHEMRRANAELASKIQSRLPDPMDYYRGPNGY